MVQTRSKKHFLDLFTKNPDAGVGFTLAAGAVFAARHGSWSTTDTRTEEWKTIARDLKTRYGESLTPDQVRMEMGV
jgi:hypothetical protein